MTTLIRKEPNEDELKPEDSSLLESNEEEEQEAQTEEEPQANTIDDSSAPTNGSNTDFDNRQIEVCFATGIELPRYDWDGEYYEVLSIDSESVDFDIMNRGKAPFLNSHSNDDAESIFGTVVRGWVDEEKKECRAIVKISTRFQWLLDEIKDGIITNFSVGFEPLEIVWQLPEGDGRRMKFIKRWRPLEISAVGIPADHASGLRKKYTKEMIVRNENSHTKKRGMVVRTENTQMKPSEQLNKESFQEQEINRSREIRKSVRAAKLGEDFADDLFNRKLTIDQARKAIIDQLEKTDSTSIRTHIVAGQQDEKVTLKRALVGAICNRINPTQNPHNELSRQYHGVSFLDVIRILENRSYGGRYQYQTPTDLAGRAFQTTSDFPEILRDSLNMTLMQSFVAAPATYPKFVKTTSAPNFKDQYRIQLGDAPRLEPVNEHQEFKRGSFKETRQNYRINTFGKIVAITRQMIVDDHMRAFEQIPTAMGLAAQDFISDMVYNLLTDQNHLMNDNYPLFDPFHHNVSEVGSTIDLDSLSEGRTKMRLQKSQEERVLGLNPNILLVPAALETKAQQFVTQNYLAGVIAGAVEQRINPFAGTLEVVCEPRLDGLSNKAWYLVAGQNINTVELAFLEGQNGPFTDSRIGFEMSGIEFLIRMDVGTGITDFRGLYKNLGPDHGTDSAPATGKPKNPK